MTDHDHDHDYDYDYDYMTQYVRAYVVPDKPAEQHAGPETPRRVSAPSAVMPRASFGAARPRSDIDRTIQTVGAPYEGWKLILDCETTTDHRQQLRYGFYQLRGLSRANRRAAARCGTLTPDALNTLQAEGVYYNPAELSETETTIIIDFARTNGLRCMTRDAFVTDVFYPWVYTYGALCIGHNLPFDLSRLATAYGPASGTYRGGFWFTLCACGHAECFDHPPLRIKKIGPHKAFIGFRTVKPPTRGLSTATSTAPGTTRRIKRARGHILDTMTLGRALLGPGAASLAALGRTFRVDVTKMEHDIAHDGPLTMDDLTYARRDVAATWALYVKEAALYTRHGVPTPIRDIYSEASLGKAYYRALGVPPFMARNPDFPPDVLGAGMVAYYGGRSEVKIRLQPTEVIYCDFKSQYPTVNALMRLQDLLTAERVEPRDCTAEVRAWLENATTNATADTNTNAGSDDMLTLLQQPASWPLLRKLVKIVPHDDVLPIRADYQGKGGALNIGLNYVTGGPIWYTLADVAASVLVTGIVPEIQQALELVPIGRVATKPWALFGDARYTIDLDRQDFFTEVINLRTDVKGDMTRAASEGERANLDALQVALKLLANSTSYGVLVEVNASETRTRATPATLYGLDTQHIHTSKVERPGRYFSGAIGTLIPAAGRLLLALAERLGHDRGIGYALCDTDSMAFARPDGMERATFGAHVDAIRAWFTPLSPYRGSPPIFEREDVNDWDGQPLPLYCLGVSAKRYALYNRPDDTGGNGDTGNGGYRIRKFSGHGLGGWSGMGGYTSPPHIPAPYTDVGQLGGPRWVYDLWYDAIAHLDGGITDRADSTPLVHAGIGRHRPALDGPLNRPAMSQVTVSTPHLLNAFKHADGVAPFNFVTMLPAFKHVKTMRRLDAWRATPAHAALDDSPYDDIAGVAFYAPFTRDPAGLRDVRRTDTNARIDIEPVTLADVIREHFTHEEHKTATPYGTGTLERRHIVSVERTHIGKEIEQHQFEQQEDSGGILPIDGPQSFTTTGLVDALRAYRVADLVHASGLPKQTISDVMHGATPDPITRKKLIAGLAIIDATNCAYIAGWRDIPDKWLGKRMGLRRSDIGKIRMGTRQLSRREGSLLVASVRAWHRTHKPTT